MCSTYWMYGKHLRMLFTSECSLTSSKQTVEREKKAERPKRTSTTFLYLPHTHPPCSLQFLNNIYCHKIVFIQLSFLCCQEMYIYFYFLFVLFGRLLHWNAVSFCILPNLALFPFCILYTPIYVYWVTYIHFTFTVSAPSIFVL